MQIISKISRLKFLLKPTFFLWLSLAIGLQALAEGNACRALFSPQTINVYPYKPDSIQPVSLGDLASLRVMTFNMKRFVYSDGKNNSAQGNEQGGAQATNFSGKAKPKETPLEHVEGAAKAIREINPDIAVLVEVGPIQGLRELNQKFLGERYQSYFIEGNDKYGFNIAFFIRRDLKADIEMRSHKHVEWMDTAENKVTHLYTRDLPVLILRDTLNKDIEYIIVGNHAKSMRSRPGDRDSSQLRLAQYEMAAQIVKDLQYEFGEGAKIIFAGDFNSNLGSPTEVASLLQVLRDPFSKFPIAEAFTHSYFRHDGEAQYRRLDGLLISPALEPKLKSAQVYRYRNEKGELLPIPRSFQERDLLPSDHYPIFIDLIN